METKYANVNIYSTPISSMNQVGDLDSLINLSMNLLRLKWSQYFPQYVCDNVSFGRNTSFLVLLILTHLTIQTVWIAEAGILETKSVLSTKRRRKCINVCESFFFITQSGWQRYSNRMSVLPPWEPEHQWTKSQDKYLQAIWIYE